ncbi:MAG: hypothetical protein ACLT2C_04820, partial [Ruminococcus sp.]
CKKICSKIRIYFLRTQALISSSDFEIAMGIASIIWETPPACQALLCKRPKFLAVSAAAAPGQAIQTQKAEQAFAHSAHCFVVCEIQNRISEAYALSIEPNRFIFSSTFAMIAS